MQEWRGHNLDPKKYGFFDFDAKLEPITYTEPLTSGHLLKTIAQSLLDNQVNVPAKLELYGCSDNCANLCPINDEVDVDTQEESNKVDITKYDMIWTYYVHCCFILLTLF